MTLLRVAPNFSMLSQRSSKKAESVRKRIRRSAGEDWTDEQTEQLIELVKQRNKESNDQIDTAKTSDLYKEIGPEIVRSGERQ